MARQLPEDCAAAKFLDALWEATWDHPIQRGARVVVDENAPREAAGWIAVNTDVNDFENAIHISEIVSCTPQPGGGKQCLALLLRLADEHSVTLTMAAKKIGTNKDKLSTAQLVKWYERHGFLKSGKYGNNHDGYDMKRPPAPVLEHSAAPRP